MVINQCHFVSHQLFLCPKFSRTSVVSVAALSLATRSLHFTSRHKAYNKDFLIDGPCLMIVLGGPYVEPVALALHQF